MERWIAALILLVCSTVIGPVSTASSGDKNKTTLVKLQEKVGGFRRSYGLHLPREYEEDRRWPLVVVLHGAFNTADGIEKHTGFSEVADREGFIVAYPNGIGLFSLFRHWNAGFCCGKAMKKEIDDVGFVLRVVDDVAGGFAVDPERIYVVGHSNGGMLAYRIAATRPQRVAAVAVFGGAIGGTPKGAGQPETVPAPLQPVPILIAHGRADESIPYEPRDPGEKAKPPAFLSAREAVAFWVEHNDCEAEPSRESICSGAVESTTWTACDNDTEVLAYSVDDWGHDWPGPHFFRRLPEDSPLRQFNSAEWMWRFLKRHRLSNQAG